ncbi:sigma-54-dependent Fis family transcriptional regulator [Flavobacterium sp. 3-210]
MRSITSKNRMLEDLSSDISNSRSKKELLYVICQTLKKFIPFDDSFILLYNKEKKTCKTFIFYAGEKRSERSDFEQQLEIEYPLENTEQEDEFPSVQDVEVLVKQGNTDVQFIHDAGIKEFVTLKLYDKNQFIGLFVLLSENKGAFTAENLNLLQNISYQIASATVNIISNEEITRQHHEKNILLSLTGEIASVRNRNDLHEVLNGSLKKIFQIKEYALSKISSDGKTYDNFILDAKKITRSHTHFEDIIHRQYSVDDPLFSQVMKTNHSLIFNINEIAAIPGMPQYVALWHSVGIKTIVAIALRASGKDIGCAYFSFELEELDDLKKYLLEGISSQLSATMSNILANEEIEKREEEKTILLSLSSELSVIKNRNDLLEIVNGRIKKLFSIEELAIAKIDDNGRTYSAFMLDLSENITNDVEFEATTSIPYNISDPLFSKTIKSNDPVIFQVNEIVKDPQMPAFVHFWKKMGLELVLCAPMRAGGKNIGMLVMHIDTNKTLSPKNSLLKGVLAQLSIAISNILANEEIIKREKERELLLSLNLAIAAVRNNDELLQVISQRLKKILGFSHTLIALINDDKNTVSAFLVDPKSKSKEHPIYEQATTKKFLLNDGILDLALSNASVSLFNLKELSENRELPLYLKVNFESGINQAAVMRFCRAGEPFGFWLLFYEKNIMPNHKWQSLLEGLTNQISIALSNIIASDEIIKKDYERKQLLMFNMDLAAVQTDRELMLVINEKLKKIVGFSHVHLTVINDDEISVTPFLYDPESKSRNHPLYKNLKGSKFLIQDGILNKSFETSQPTMIDFEQLKKEQELPLYALINYESGIHQVVTTRFTNGDRIFGFWMLFFDKKIAFDHHQVSLIKGISDQISIALSNIIASEEIKKREYERNTLLLLNMDLAAVRTNEDLMFVITEKLKKILHFSHAHLVRINDDRTTVTPYLYDPHSKSQNHPLYKKLKGNKFAIADGILDKSIITADPTLVDFEELSKEQQLPLYGIINYESGIKQCVTTRFISGDIVFGFWMMFFDKKIVFDSHQSSLIKSISDQMSIAIANIFANQEIESQEREKSMLLEFSNAIASVRDNLSLSLILAQQFKKIFNIDQYSIHLLSEDKSTHTPAYYDPQAEYAKHPAFLKMIDSPTDVNDGVFNIVLSSDNPVAFNPQKWTSLETSPVYAKFAVDNNLKQVTGMRIRLGEENIGLLYFSHEESFLPVSKYPLVKSISSQVAVAISNITAREKILNQLKEIKQYKKQLEEENIYLQEEIVNTQNFAEMIGESSEMKKVFHMVNQVAPSDSTVLLLGETGTGKELIARAIHNSSPRYNKLMVKVNCAALPANLIESELFGHERGSFTGATERRIGKFELANNGTLFLDEIGEMPLELQVKLLRALQEKEIERLGGKTTIQVDVRIIAATNRNLEKMMDEGTFRSDLYYRLNIFPINLPPLRDRKEDIPALASHFIKRFSKKTGKAISSLSNKALQDMIQYNWPGNVRELEHLMERSVLLAQGDTIKGILLPSKNNPAIVKEDDTLEIKTMDDYERSYIMKILKYTGGRIAGYGGAAELLGIPPTTLHSRMKRLGIKKEHISSQ